MNELAFIRPWWLLAIPPALAFVWWLRRRHGRGGGWESIVDPTLLPHLVVGADGTRREWPWIVMAVAIAVAGLALAGPAFETVERPAFRSLAARVIVLDASHSMDARDLAPSRMVHARHKVSDLLRRSRDRRTGLVVFAGDAFVVAPLTRDADTLVHLLSATDTSVVPVQGSRPDLGLLAAGRLLERGHATAGEIVLVTDGETKPMARDAAERLAARGISVSILAVGTREGAPIPLAEGRFLERPGGEIVVPRVDIEALRAVAEAGTGRFATITADDADVEWLLGTRTAIPWRADSGGDRTDQRRVARRRTVARVAVAADGGSGVSSRLAPGLSARTVGDLSRRRGVRARGPVGTAGPADGARDRAGGPWPCRGDRPRPPMARHRALPCRPIPPVGRSVRRGRHRRRPLQPGQRACARRRPAGSARRIPRGPGPSTLTCRCRAQSEHCRVADRECTAAPARLERGWGRRGRRGRGADLASPAPPTRSRRFRGQER